jgi:hypothetical protein
MNSTCHCDPGWKGLKGLKSPLLVPFNQCIVTRLRHLQNVFQAGKGSIARRQLIALATARGMVCATTHHAPVPWDFRASIAASHIASTIARCMARAHPTALRSQK